MQQQTLVYQRAATKQQDGAKGYLYLHSWGTGYQLLVFTSKEAAANFLVACNKNIPIIPDLNETEQQLFNCLYNCRRDSFIGIGYSNTMKKTKTKTKFLELLKELKSQLPQGKDGLTRCLGGFTVELLEKHTGERVKDGETVGTV